MKNVMYMVLALYIVNELLTARYPYIDTDYGSTSRQEIAMEVVEGKLWSVLPEKNDGQLEESISINI
ncbi:Serine/Threonine kinase family protein [Quillaja saponaria]|uniref:Serine/Threonine kinase family protein n=1 Tax=Quillaja saponaria TaxID=32244 RepID=A0AAD7PT01_QUISA|nr:Serine/Threonine kinase family protein [Quillaja saponaria]